MAIVRYKRSELPEEPNVDWERVDATMEEDIRAQALEGGSADFDLTAVHTSVPRIDLLELRTRLGLSIVAFARRYSLSSRTVEQWEQGRRRPSEAARVLLYAIDRDPVVIARVLRPDA